VGAKVTEILQLAPTAKILGEIGHFEVCLKSPETEILLITSGTVPLLLKVTVLAVLVVPTTQFPKDKLLGLTVCALAVRVLQEIRASASSHRGLLGFLPTFGTAHPAISMLNRSL
jgi:hypothetical protein